jgi:hypothetical protein
MPASPIYGQLRAPGCHFLDYHLPLDHGRAPAALVEL